MDQPAKLFVVIKTITSPVWTKATVEKVFHTKEEAYSWVIMMKNFLSVGESDTSIRNYLDNGTGVLCLIDRGEEAKRIIFFVDEIEAPSYQQPEAEPMRIVTGTHAKTGKQIPVLGAKRSIKGGIYGVTSEGDHVPLLGGLKTSVNVKRSRI
jgi:hypothetical protein